MTPMLHTAPALDKLLDMTELLSPDSQEKYFERWCIMKDSNVPEKVILEVIGRMMRGER